MNDTTTGTTSVLNPDVFSTIPAELVIQILLRSLEDVVDYSSVLHQRAQVCTRWRDVILSEPTFWSFVSLEYGDQWIKWAVRKSGDVPLTLFWWTLSYASLELINRHIHRCRTLVLDCYTVPPDVLYNPPPGLQAFIISDEWPLIHPATYITSPLPTDREISIPSRLVKVFSQLMTDLTSLKIHLYQPPVPLACLTQALSSSPRLRLLSLKAVSFTGRFDDLSPSSITLPALEAFTVRRLSQIATITLIRAINAPKCVEVMIEGLPDPQELLHPIPGGLSVMIWSARGEAENLSICSSGSRNVPAIRYSTPKISITLDIYRTQDPLSLLDGPPEHFRPVTSLEIESKLFSTAELEDLASRTPLVENLTLLSHPGDLVELPVDTDGVSLWPKLSLMSSRVKGKFFSRTDVIRILQTHTQSGSDQIFSSALSKSRSLSIHGATHVFDDGKFEDEIGAFIKDVKFERIDVTYIDGYPSLYCVT